MVLSQDARYLPTKLSGNEKMNIQQIKPPRLVLAALAAAAALTVPAPAGEAGGSGLRLDTGPLGQFSVGRWQRLQITTNAEGEGTLLLDPNRAMWDGFSPTWASTKIALRPVKIRLEAVRRSQPPREGRAAAMRLFQVRTVDAQPGFEELGLGSGLRLAVRKDGGMARLLVLGEGDRATRSLIMGPAEAPQGKPTSDRFSYRSGFLGGQLGRTSFITIKGSVQTKKARLEMDPNRVVLDAAGNPSISTRMAALPHEVSLVEVRLPAEAAARCRVFTLEGAPMPMRLVLPRHRGGAARLVLLDQKGAATGFLRLEPVSSFTRR